MANVLRQRFRLSCVTVLLGFVSGAAASGCPQVDADSGFVAHYNLHTADTLKAVTMVKQPGWVAYYGAGHGPVDLWHRLPAGHAQLYRAFPQHKRSILHTISALDLKGQPSQWQRVANLIDTRQLRVVATHATACGALEQLEGSLGRFHVEASWYSERHLLVRVALTPKRADDKTEVRHYQLTSVEGAQAASDLVAEWRTYRSTDFADIGDNESDPILAKMMRSDFVGHSRRGAYKDGKQDRRVYDEEENEPASLRARLRQ